MPITPLVEFDRHFVAGLGNRLESRGGRIADFDLVNEARIIRQHDRTASPAAEIANDGGAAAFEHAEDATDFLAGALALAAGYSRASTRSPGNAVPVSSGKNLQRGFGRRAGRRLADDKSGSTSAKLDAADEFPAAELRCGGDTWHGRYRRMFSPWPWLGSVAGERGLGFCAAPGRSGRAEGALGRRGSPAAARCLAGTEDLAGGNTRRRGRLGGAGNATAAIAAEFTFRED
jgi:hypothetical protein